MVRKGDAKSHRVGRATVVTDSAITTAYRAVVVVPCGQCGRIVAPDDLFSRRSTHASIGSMGLTLTAPICTTCRPLRLDSDTGDGDGDGGFMGEG